MSKARIVSQKPYPASNTSKENRLKNIAKRTHEILGVQKSNFFEDFFIETSLVINLRFHNPSKKIKRF